MKKLFFLLCFAILQTACQNGQYIGPSIGVSGGYEGATVGFTLYGQNPVARGNGLTNGPITLTSGTEKAVTESP